MEIIAIIFGIIVAVGVMSFLFRTFFGDKEGFFECIKFWLTPDIFSLFKGQYSEDFWSEMKLGVWVFLGGCAGFATYTGLLHILT
jgi:hypothetical protein